MSALTQASLGVLCSNKGLGMATLGAVCDAAAPVVIDRSGGAAPRPAVLNVLARLQSVPRPQLAARHHLRPLADAQVRVVGEALSVLTTPPKTRTEARATVQGVSVAPAVGRAVPSAGAFVGLEPSGAITFAYAIPAPSGESLIPVQGEVLLATVERQITARGVKNPTDEQLVALIQQVRRRRR